MELIQNRKHRRLLDELRSEFSTADIHMACKTLDMIAMPDQRRVVELGAGQLICVKEGVEWYSLYGSVWCLRSMTQCDWCGPISEFIPPRLATLTDDFEFLAPYQKSQSLVLKS